MGIVDRAHNYLDKHHEPTKILVISRDIDMLSAIRVAKDLCFKVILAVDERICYVLRQSVLEVQYWKLVTTIGKGLRRISIRSN